MVPSRIQENTHILVQSKQSPSRLALVMPPIASHTATVNPACDTARPTTCHTKPLHCSTWKSLEKPCPIHCQLLSSPRQESWPSSDNQHHSRSGPRVPRRQGLGLSVEQWLTQSGQSVLFSENSAAVHFPMDERRQAST